MIQSQLFYESSLPQSHVKLIKSWQSHKPIVKYCKVKLITVTHRKVKKKTLIDDFPIWGFLKVP
jgi:hypothetical protein